MSDHHNTNPLAPARLTIRVETNLGPRTVVTSKLDRLVASAIVDALASVGVAADLHDDMGAHTVKELVRRKRARQKQIAIIAQPAGKLVQFKKDGAR